MSALPIAVTCGDPAGIGPELLAGWLQAHPEQAASVVPIGPADWIARLGTGLAVGPADFITRPGQPDEAGQLISKRAKGTLTGKEVSEQENEIQSLLAQDLSVRLKVDPGNSAFSPLYFVCDITLKIIGALVCGDKLHKTIVRNLGLLIPILLPYVGEPKLRPVMSWSCYGDAQRLPRCADGLGTIRWRVG